MKTKSFAMLAVSVLLTASLAGAAPAMAEDLGSEMPMDPSMADSATSMQVSDNSSIQAASADTNQATNSPSTENVAGLSANNSPTATSTEEGTPDTATGDDDY